MNYKGIKDQKFNCVNCNIEFPFKGHSYNHKFCTLPCSHEFTKKNTKSKEDVIYETWLSGQNIEKLSRKLVRKFLTKLSGYKCSVCSIDSHMGKPITLWVDHIDGDASNNTYTNFRLICPNCDSQSDTFGAKNYGNGRKSKGLSQYG
jgi:hypothetical protein